MASLMWLPPVANAATLTVSAGGDLQAALDAAHPGDTIVLQAGAAFTGNFTLPAKGGTSYITIRSSAPDASLPASGVRITPAYASLLPKIRSDQNGPALRTESGASYWRLRFLELYPSAPESAAGTSANLVEFGAATSSQATLSRVPHHLVIDRCYLHGSATFGQRRGVALNSGDAQILNSYFANFKAAAQDAQAIAGWNGPGPFLIENNYVEAAGENILFGGGDPAIPNLVPSNITIRRNLITKSLAWRTQSWVVKNLVEFKNARHVLVEGNVIENNWAAGQQGYSILMTPRNQGGTAPWTVVTDITIRNNIIRHVAAVFNILGYDDIHPSQQTATIVIHNNLVYDVSTAFNIPNHPANGRLAVIGAGPRDITIDHLTVDSNGSATIFIYGGASPTGTQITGFRLTNNLLRDNGYGLYGDRIGEGNAALKAYSPNAVVLRNAFGGSAASGYPTGNEFPTLTNWLASFRNPAAGDYRLVSTNPWKGGGTDSKDLGVDFAALNAALNATSTSPSPPPSVDSTPFTGTAVSVPGRIEAEDYDAGGEGIAYHDTTSGNGGGVYRTNNVDLLPASDTSGGYALGWTKAGEWLKYTVDVTAAGTYAFDVRVASDVGGGTFHIEVDGVNKSGSLTIPDTGGWQMWKTITKTGISLAAGQQVIRLVIDANGATGSVGNINWIELR